MNQKGQIVEILSTSSVYREKEQLVLCNEVDFLSESQKRPYSLFDGILVGEHRGLGDFKLGQRKGINVGGKKKPLYVIGFHNVENRLFVGEGADHPGLFTKILAFDKTEIQMLGKTLELGSPIDVEVKLELQESRLPAKLSVFNHYAFLQFNDFIKIDVINHQISVYSENTLLFNNNLNQYL